MLIFGTRQKGEIAGYAPSRCSFCGPTVLGVIQKTKKFTLYFIPVLTYGKESTALCAQCGSECYLPEGTKLYATDYAALTALAAQEAQLESRTVPTRSIERATTPEQSTERAYRACKGPGCSNTTSTPDGLCWGCFNNRQKGWAN